MVRVALPSPAALAASRATAQPPAVPPPAGNGWTRSIQQVRRHNVQEYLAKQVDPLIATIVERFLRGAAGRVRGPKYALLDVLRAMCAEEGVDGIPKPGPASSNIEGLSTKLRQAQVASLKPILARCVVRMVAERPAERLPFAYGFVCGEMVIEAAQLIQHQHRARRYREAHVGMGTTFEGDDEAGVESSAAPSAPVSVLAISLRPRALAVRICGRSRHRWRLVWGDEFEDGDGLPNPQRWAFQTNCNKWIHDAAHKELQWYTEGRPENARVHNGVLHITARAEQWEGCQFTSARLHTRGLFEFKYGRVEVCARLPPWHRGLWPAIWMLPAHSAYGRWPDSGEIDLMEAVGWQPNGTVHASVHTAAFNHRQRTQSHGAYVVPDASEAFHTYGLEWSPRALTFFVDDHKYHAFRRVKEGGSAEWPFDQPCFLLLNLAIGGNWGGKEGVDESGLPATLEIRSVRVFKRVRRKAAGDQAGNGRPRRSSVATDEEDEDPDAAVDDLNDLTASS